MPPSGSGRGAGRSPGRGGARTSTGDLSRIGVKRREERAPRAGAPYLVPGGLALAAALAAWLSWGRILSCGASLQSPETQIREALRHQDRAQLDDVYGFHAGGTVELVPVRFEDVVPSVEGGRALVVAVLQAEGRVVWRDGAARLAYVGREVFHMKPCAIARWCGEGDQFSRLRGVLLALFRRHDAWQRRDREAYARLVAREPAGEARAEVLRRVGAALEAAAPARVVAWQIRVERDGAEVGEDLEVEGPGGGRERHVYRLVREDERWTFAAGL